MPYKFRMILGGLCAFVPTPDLKEVRALMVNTDPQAGHGRVAQLGHVPEFHTPTLIYDRVNEVGANPAIGSRTAIWPLDDEEITVKAPVKKPLTIVGPLTGGKSGSPGTNRDIDWVPDLSDILPSAGKIETDCLDQNPKKEFLKARVLIDQDTLKVDEFASFKAAEVLADFVPLPSGAKIARQALPHRVVWEIEVPDGQSVAIQSRPFAAAANTAAPILNLQLATSKPDVEVLLVNLCCGNYLKVPPPTKLDPDDDFECFYMLLDNFLTLVKPLPIPVAVKDDSTAVGTAVGGTAGGIRCTMSRMAAQ